MKIIGIVVASSLVLSHGLAAAQSGGQQLAGAPLCEARAAPPDPCAPPPIPEGAVAGGVGLLLIAGAGAALGLGSGDGGGATGTTSTTSTTPTTTTNN